MSTAALVPVEEYLRMTGKPYSEYRDGVVSSKPMPTWAHGILQAMLVQLLRQQGLHAASEVSLRISSTKVLIPDVIGARSVENPYPTKPVLLCCEIQSPDDRLGATFAKCEEYHAWGVPFCWVIDPEKRSAWEYHNAGEPERSVEALQAGDIVARLEELFSALNA